LFTMIHDAVPNHFSSYLFGDCPNKIAIFPEFSASDLPLYLRLLMKYHAGTDAHNHLCRSRNRISWWKAKKEMQMVFCNLQYVYLKIMILRTILKYLLHSLSIGISENPLFVFRNPYQMIFCLIALMRSSFHFYAVR